MPALAPSVSVLVCPKRKQHAWPEEPSSVFKAVCQCRKGEAGPSDESEWGRELQRNGGLWLGGGPSAGSSQKEVALLPHRLGPFIYFSLCGAGLLAGCWGGPLAPWRTLRLMINLDRFRRAPAPGPPQKRILSRMASRRLPPPPSPLHHQEPTPAGLVKKLGASVSQFRSSLPPNLIQQNPKSIILFLFVLILSTPAN